MCTSLTNCVFFARPTETGRDVSSHSRGESATNLSVMGDNLSLICWGDRGTSIPVHEHRVEIIRQTPDNRSITNITASGILDTIVRPGSFCYRAGRFAAWEEAILRCYSNN